ncbi:MAG: LPS export ABC transporter periplasmic protein LptC [Gammaproteobacteria bacterium]|nr:LPS export ABC transporter periplasmic protein LptC [Gammaproteobacteria bacterium]
MIDTRGLAFTVLLAAAIGSYWWLSQQAGNQPDSDEQARQPDSYFTDLLITSHDADGLPGSFLRARRAEHFPDDPYIYLADLHSVAELDEARWELSAPSGRLDSETEILEARGDVELSKAGNDQKLTLETSHIVFDPGKEVARSDEAVLIRQGESSIRGEGLLVDMQRQYIAIEREVVARYAKK